MKLHELIQNKETVKEQYYHEERFAMIREGKGYDANHFDRQQQKERKAATDSGNRTSVVHKPYM